MREGAFLWVTPAGLRWDPDRASLGRELGEKARGLLLLPPPWVPPFFALSPEFQNELAPSGSDSCVSPSPSLVSLVESAMTAVGISAEPLILRSNAPFETLENRGRYKSLACSSATWISSLLDIYRHAMTVDGTSHISVLFQARRDPILLGHLSNERRVAREYRDAEVELIDASTGRITSERISHRSWRRDLPPTADALQCTSRADVPQALREPLALAVRAQTRMHFEWVWDGRFLYVVQADQAFEYPGQDPSTFVTATTALRSVEGLKRFREVSEADAAVSRKVANHLAYKALGLPQPRFFILTQPSTLEALGRGEIEPELAEDLDRLTRSPLMLRTSTVTNTVPFLPRSDVLSSVADARAWLLDKFTTEIARSGLPLEGLSLLGHHYIPALAAAWSRAVPGERKVEIESLWGIPEGLYYYPCDRYVVYTDVLGDTDLDQANLARFQYLESIQYKEFFVAPDLTGRFVRHRTAATWDWKSTIPERTLLGSIALLTRRLAAAEGSAVRLMWFVGCRPDSGFPPALPWYHEPDTPRVVAAEPPRIRSLHDTTYELHTATDLARIEALSQSAQEARSDLQVVIRVNPAEDSILRDSAFAQRLGVASKSLRAIVELQGGILTHFYYELCRTGAVVSVRSQASLSPSPTSLRKLVRDRIPEAVAAHGEAATISRLRSGELRAALKIKLVEEAFEVRDSAPETLAEEIADVLEILKSLCQVADLSWDDVERLRQSKRKKRGGFDEGVVLIETQPDPPRPEPAPQLFHDDVLPGGGAGAVIESPLSPALERAEPVAFDRRMGAGSQEFVQRAEIGLAYPKWTIRSPRGIRLAEAESGRDVAWVIEGQRRGAQMTLRLRISICSDQLRFPFDDELSD